MFGKRKSAVEGKLKKNWSGIEAKSEVEQKEAELEGGSMGVNQKEEGLIFGWIERKTPVLRLAL